MWIVQMPKSGIAHITPHDDQIVHEVHEDCICGPLAETVVNWDGSIGWLITHYSLDGREKKEEAT